MTDDGIDYLRKQAWDYFHLHANQRLAVFNFYIVISSVTATSYFASFKLDSNLQNARPALSSLLCILAFLFWKLDQRTKVLVKNAERALKFFESQQNVDNVAKVFTREEMDTADSHLEGWRRICIWNWPLSFSNCFSVVFMLFFFLGLFGLLKEWR